MNSSWSIIKEIESNNSRLFKESIVEREAEALNIEFFEGCKLALDSMITFGLKQISEKKDEDGPGLSWDSFTLVITGFVNRKLTGNAARDVVSSMMKTATKDQWNNWYRRILIKDLRCGMSEKTINNVVTEKFPQFQIPVFSCQLAHGAEGNDSKMIGEKMIEVKLDGVRVITIVYPEGKVDQFSRNGKELLNFTKIKEQFSSIANNFSEPMVFDGEVMSSSFQDLMKQVHRKDNVSADDAVLYLFDILTLEEFEFGQSDIPQFDRSNMLDDVYQNILSKCANIRKLSYEVVDLDTEQGQRKFSELNRSALDNHYEGLMIKDPTAGYECKRSVSWLKLKPFIEVSLEIKHVEEGTGRNKGRLGAFVLEGVDDGKDIRVNCGSGFSDSDRDQFYLDRASLIGQIVEVRADAVTQNQDGTYSLRFPRFLRFRGFEAGEKI